MILLYSVPVAFGLLGLVRNIANSLDYTALYSVCDVRLFLVQ